MYLELLVLFLPHIYAGIKNPYEGFDMCWYGGWECRNYKGESISNNHDRAIYEVTYNCENYSREVRLWVWTARLPESTKRFAIKNCNHIELHIDCTASFRGTKIEEFQVINVNHLEILNTSTGYLHDNGRFHHLPPLFYMENIRLMTFFKGALEVTKEQDCQYNSGMMKKLVMKKVNIEKMEEASSIGEYDVFWSEVKVKEINSNAINITGNITIEDSHFLDLRKNGMSFVGQNVILRRNTYDVLNEASIKVTSFKFNFTENKMNEIVKRGLSVRSSQINIEKNHIVHLDNGAFSDISPYYYKRTGTYELSYAFVGNAIEILAPFSLHCNWNEYEKTCTNFNINDNKFDCSCYNLVWLNAFHKNRSLENAGFYDIFLNTTHHCGTSINCSLSQIMKFVCHNETSIESQCADFREKENIEIATEKEISYQKLTSDANPSNFEEMTNLSREISYERTTAKSFGFDPTRGYRSTEKNSAERAEYSRDSNNPDLNGRILDKGFFTDHSVSPKAPVYTFPSWILVIIVIAFIGLIASIAVACYFKRRNNQKFFQIYKYEKNKDSDNLIAGARIEGGNIECSNNFAHE